MNKKEISEIRRQYVPERCTISRICGCYVDAEKNIKATMKEAFLSLPEDDAFKYFTIFKKTLSGTVGTALTTAREPAYRMVSGWHFVAQGKCDERLLLAAVDPPRGQTR